jgi:hypothetical protein
MLLGDDTAGIGDSHKGTVSLLPGRECDGSHLWHEVAGPEDIPGLRLDRQIPKPENMGRF